MYTSDFAASTCLVLDKWDYLMRVLICLSWQKMDVSYRTVICLSWRRWKSNKGFKAHVDNYSTVVLGVGVSGFAIYFTWLRPWNFLCQLQTKWETAKNKLFWCAHEQLSAMRRCFWKSNSSGGNNWQNFTYHALKHESCPELGPLQLPCTFRFPTIPIS